jgi:hypothetical protein
MVSQIEKANCVQWFHESRAAVAEQRRFAWCFGKNHKQKCRFTSDMNCFVRLAASANSRERQPVTEHKVAEVRGAFACSPRKSTKLTTGQLNMPHITMQSTLQKSFKGNGTNCCEM